MASRVIRWPCMFRHPMIREDVNPRLYRMNPKVPFGAFQKIWRTEHCSQLDVYGTGACPYRPEDCATAYYQSAASALMSAEKSKIGFFRLLARASGAERADNKPRAREILRTDGQEGSRHPGAAPGDLDEGRGVRGGRMAPISSLLRKTDGRSLLASSGGREGEAGTERRVPPDGDVRGSQRGGPISRPSDEAT